MPSLYEINQSLLACIDNETGEVIDPEALDALMMERDQKIENIALWIKNLESDAQAFKEEKEAFADRQRSAENKAEQLRKYLTQALDGQKFSTTKCAVSFRSSESVEIPDESKIPKKYLTKTVVYKPDKKAIKEALKAGIRVKGCSLLSKLNPQIK